MRQHRRRPEGRRTEEADRGRPIPRHPDFGVGGPNFTSSFHVIGEIFDKVYMLGGLLSPPLQGIQTVTVAPGGALVVEFKVDVPGNYTLVDHALARAERGLLGILSVEGPPNPDIYNGQVMPGMGH
jgi:nitrite reductase (NO-forming)